MARKVHIWSFLITIVCLALFDANYIHSPKTSSTHFHKTLYLDRRFTDAERQVIKAAAEEWTDTTNHLVEFEVEVLPADRLDLVNGILVRKVSGYEPEIYLIDVVGPKGNEVLGLYTNFGIMPSIKLVSERLQDDDYAVVLHEMGHAVGLEHNSEPYTLMYPFIGFGADFITDHDLQQVCRVYHCPSNQQELPHP
jgi:predicted Zn-dependent protease with MMP-like domain